jgi:hypothetical protein
MASPELLEVQTETENSITCFSHDPFVISQQESFVSFISEYMRFCASSLRLHCVARPTKVGSLAVPAVPDPSLTRTSTAGASYGGDLARVPPRYGNRRRVGYAGFIQQVPSFCQPGKASENTVILWRIYRNRGGNRVLCPRPLDQ